MSRKKVISRARLSSTLRKFSKKYVSFRPPFWLGPTFFLHSPQLCPNRVCPASNSIPSDFGAKRKFLPNLENFRLSRPGTLRKIFFVKNFFLQSPRLCLNRVCPASNSIPSDFGADRSWSPNLENFRVSYTRTARDGPRNFDRS